MFKIYDDKVYFVAETPDINKVIEMQVNLHSISTPPSRWNSRMQRWIGMARIFAVSSPISLPGIP